ncbi:MAG: AAA family ATPase [Candidatus Aenigmatarchaeota archaeon]
MSYYIIIRGPAGVGKTEISKRLAKRIKGYHISMDVILHKNKLDTVKGRCILKENFLKANKLTIPLAIKKLEKGRIVIFDGCFYHKTQIIHLTKNLPYHHFIFTLKANVEECIRRDVKRKSIGEKSIKAVHKLMSFDYGTVINTDKKTPERTLQKIIFCLPTSSSD